MKLLNKIKFEMANVSDALTMLPRVNAISMQFNNCEIEEMKECEKELNGRLEYKEEFKMMKFFYTDGLITIHCWSKPCKVVTTVEIITE